MSNFVDLFNEDSIIRKLNATSEVNRQKRKNLEKNLKDKYNNLRKETRTMVKDKSVKETSFNFGSNLDL